MSRVQTKKKVIYLRGATEPELWSERVTLDANATIADFKRAYDKLNVVKSHKELASDSCVFVLVGLVNGMLIARHLLVDGCKMPYLYRAPEATVIVYRAEKVKVHEWNSLMYVGNFEMPIDATMTVEALCNCLVANRPKLRLDAGQELVLDGLVANHVPVLQQLKLHEINARVCRREGAATTGGAVHKFESSSTTTDASEKSTKAGEEADAFVPLGIDTKKKTKVGEEADAFIPLGIDTKKKTKTATAFAGGGSPVVGAASASSSSSSSHSSAWEHGLKLDAGENPQKTGDEKQQKNGQAGGPPTASSTLPDTITPASTHATTLFKHSPLSVPRAVWHRKS